MDRTKQETNKHGNIVTRSFADLDRYHFDVNVCSASKGWKQYDTDQDAWYFGVWVNPEKLLTMSYAEGDVTLVTCISEESYHAELKEMAEFYGNPPPAFKAYNLKNNTVTHIYDERPV